jgi:hypothetical protein
VSEPDDDLALRTSEVPVTDDGVPSDPGTDLELELESQLAETAEPEPRTQWQLFRRRFSRHRLAVVSLVLLIVLYVLSFGGASRMSGV